MQKLRDPNESEKWTTCVLLLKTTLHRPSNVFSHSLTKNRIQLQMHASKVRAKLTASVLSASARLVINTENKVLGASQLFSCDMPVPVIFTSGKVRILFETESPVCQQLSCFRLVDTANPTHFLAIFDQNSCAYRFLVREKKTL